MIANWETSRSVIPAQLIPLLTYALDVEVTDLLPDLRKPVAPIFPSDKKTDSKIKKADEKKNVAGWVSLKSMFVKQVLAPVFARFHGPRPPHK
jgi:hypothetical protein